MFPTNITGHVFSKTPLLFKNIKGYLKSFVLFSFLYNLTSSFIFGRVHSKPLLFAFPILSLLSNLQSFHYSYAYQTLSFLNIPITFLHSLLILAIPLSSSLLVISSFQFPSFSCSSCKCAFIIVLCKLEYNFNMSQDLSVLIAITLLLNRTWNTLLVFLFLNIIYGSYLVLTYTVENIIDETLFWRIWLWYIIAFRR